MEEKIIIKSKFDSQVKNGFKTLIFIFLGLSILFLIAALIRAIQLPDINYNKWKVILENNWFNPNTGKYHVYSYPSNLIYDTFEEAWLNHGIEKDTWYDYFLYHGECLTLNIIHWSLLFLAIVFAIFLWAFSKFELTVSDKNVKGKALFGKEVILPIHMISAYSTRRWLSTITITTASGITKFHSISNYKEIAEVLQKLINEKQSAPQTYTPSVAPAQKGNYIEELKGLKELLDSGIITEEEFNEKKKKLFS